MTTRMSLLAAAAFFSARFCFSDLPDFLLLDWRGDLSATASSSGFGWRSATPGAAPADGCRAGPSLDLGLTVLGLQTPRNGFESIRGDPPLLTRSARHPRGTARSTLSWRRTRTEGP